MKDITSGPSTVVALFSYGDVKPLTHECLMRDTAHTANVMGAIAKQNQILKILHDGHINTNSLLSRMPAIRGWDIRFFYPHADALIDRSRALTVKKFLLETNAEVLVMIDHDIGWRGRDAGYEGDICHIARRCAEKRSIVGGLVSKKIRGQGVAVLWDPDGEGATKDGFYDVGKERMVEVVAVGAAFTAYHRECLQAVTDTMEDIPPGFPPIFLPAIVNHPMDKSSRLHMSEDWMFAHRAKQLGYRCWISTMPLTRHVGEYAYEVVQDAQLQESECVKKPKFSLLYATRGRPECVKNIVEKWSKNSSKEYAYELIISIDDDDEIMKKYDYSAFEKLIPEFSISVVANKNRGCVDAYNAAYKRSTGDILIQLHDDLTPPEKWDKLILAKIPDINSPSLLHVSDGLPEKVNGKPWLITIPIGTRAFFNQLNYFFYPKYVSVFCDDDLSLVASKKGCIVNAKDITFQHTFSEKMDETRKRSYSQENWKIGQEIFNERRKNGFDK
jgi:hypothetical protein